MDNKEPLALWLPELNSWQINKVREMKKAEYARGFADGQAAGVLDGEIKQDVYCPYCDEPFSKSGVHFCGGAL